jgi:hypothetical protein
MAKGRETRTKGQNADPEQYQRFLEAARELGCEESAEQMEEVIKRAAKLPSERRDRTRNDRSDEQK